MIEVDDIDINKLLVGWLGPPDRETGYLPTANLWVPDALIDFHRRISRWDVRMITLKKMYAVDRLRSRDGKTVFLEDPTGDWLWAVDQSDPDAVFETELHGEWMRSDEPLREFLVHNLLSEATYAAAAWREGSLPTHLVRDALGSMEEVRFKGWRWPTPGGRVFMGQGTIAEIFPVREPEHFQVRIGATDPRLLGRVDAIKDVLWLRYPRE